MSNSLQLVPSQGGDLITTTSDSQIGLSNWVEKLNFRREYADEARREGDVLLRLNDQLPLGQQPFLPNTNEEINLIANARHPNGSNAIIIGTPSTIYRFLGEVSEGGDSSSGSESSIAVYYQSPFTGATGEDSLGSSYPVYGVEVKSLSDPLDQITIQGDWSIPIASNVEFTNSGGQKHLFKILATTAYDSINDQTVWTVQEDIPTPQSADSPVDSGATYAAWASGTPYAVGVIVSYGGVLYACTSAGTSSTTPPPSDTSVSWSQVGVLSNIASLAIGDLMTGPESLMPIYATSSTNIWEAINPKLNPCDPESEPYLFGTTGYHRWEVENINGVIIFNNGYDLPFSYDLTKVEGEFIYELRDNGYAFVDNMASLNGILTFQDTAEFNTNAHVEQMNTSDERGINAYAGAYGPVRDLTKITRVHYQIIGAPAGEPTRWGPVLKVDTTSGSPDIITDYPIGSWADGDSLRIEEAGASAGYSSWANGVNYGTGIIISHAGVLYQSQNSGLSSGTSPIDDIGVSWQSTGSDVNLNLETSIADGFYSILQLSVSQPGAIASGGVISFDVGRQTVSVTEGVEITLTSTATQVRDALISKYAANSGTEWDDLRTKFSLAADGTDSIKIEALGAYANCIWPTVYNLDSGLGNSGVSFTRTVVYTLNDNAQATQTNVTALEPDIFELSPQPFSYPLQDDSSEILRAKELQNRLIIFKDTAIFQATLTNDPLDPLEFKLLYRGDDSIYWRWTLALVGSGQSASRGDFLVFAGRNKFYRFDLTTNSPTILPKLSLCDNLFFKNNDEDQMERVYASVNSLTSEVWFTIPEAPTHKVIAWDWRWNTCSTLNYYPTASATCELDTGDRPSTHYFLFGRVSTVQKATLYMYGLANRPQTFFGYKTNTFGTGGYYDLSSSEWVDRAIVDNSISSGAGPTDEFNDEILKSYQVILSSLSEQSAGVNVILYGKINPHATEDVLFDKQLPNPEVENTVQTYFLKHYYRDQVKADSYGFIALSKRIFDFFEVESESTTKDTDA